MNISQYHALHGRPIGNVERTVLHTCLAATTNGAIAAYPYLGRKQKNAADGAAVTAIEAVLRSAEYPGEICIGEGEADAAPGLFHGQRFGIFPEGLTTPVVGYAVDPIEGTTLLANGADNSVSVLAAVLNGYGVIKTGPDRYVNTIVLPPYIKNLLTNAQSTGVVPRDAPFEFDLHAPLLKQPFGVVLRALAALAGKDPGDFRVELLDRPRNQGFIDQLLSVGCRQALIPHGNIMSAIRALSPQYKSVDLAYGIGGSAEASIMAVITQVYGGDFEEEIWIDPEDDREAQIMDFAKHGYEEGVVYPLDQIARGRVMFAITAISNTGVLSGITVNPETSWLHTASLYGRASTGSIYTSFGEHTKPPKRVPAA